MLSVGAGILIAEGFYEMLMLILLLGCWFLTSDTPFVLGLGFLPFIGDIFLELFDWLLC